MEHWNFAIMEYWKNGKVSSAMVENWKVAILE